MIWPRLICVLLVLCGTARSFESVRTEPADRLSLPVSGSLLRAGLDPAIASDIQSDLSRKAFSIAEAKLIEHIGDSKNREALLETLAGVFFLDANYLEAAIAYKKAESYAALSETARFTLVMSYIELKRARWAHDELLRLINESPRQALYHYWLGRLDYDEQKFSDGIASFNRAIEIDDRFLRAYDGRGLCDEAMGNISSAEESYQRANILNSEQGSHYAWPPLDYGAMLAKLARYKEATSLLNEALAIDPSLAKAHYELGRVEEQGSYPEEAIRDFAAAARLDPSDPSPVYALFRLYRKAGKEDLAAKAMARFRDLKARQSKDTR